MMSLIFTFFERDFGKNGANWKIGQKWRLDKSKNRAKLRIEKKNEKLEIKDKIEKLKW